MSRARLLSLCAASSFLSAGLVYVMPRGLPMTSITGFVFGLLVLAWLPSRRKGWIWVLAAVLVSSLAHYLAVVVAIQVYTYKVQASRFTGYPAAGFVCAGLLSLYLLIRNRGRFRAFWAVAGLGALLGWPYQAITSIGNGGDFKEFVCLAVAQSIWQMGVGYLLLRQALKNEARG